jgi:hypothetical protein
MRMPSYKGAELFHGGPTDWRLAAPHYKIEIRVVRILTPKIAAILGPRSGVGYSAVLGGSAEFGIEIPTSSLLCLIATSHC